MLISLLARTISKSSIVEKSKSIDVIESQQNPSRERDVPMSLPSIQNDPNKKKRKNISDDIALPKKISKSSSTKPKISAPKPPPKIPAKDKIIKNNNSSKLITRQITITEHYRK